MRILLCPITSKIISPNNQIGAYIRYQSKLLNISRKELKLLILKKTYPELFENNLFKSLYEKSNYSLPDFKNIYGLPYKQTEFLIDYFSCKKRTHKEAVNIGAKKSKITNLKRYGVDQTFKVKEFDDKRKQTYLKNYGVDNPFKLKSFHSKMDEVYKAKYGVSLRERRSIKSKEAWASKTEKEKIEWLDNSIKNSKSVLTNFGTSLEKRITNILLDHSIPFLTQKKIARYLFDIYIPKLNTLIEVNGTIWHADPRVFNPNDKLPVSKKISSDVWDYDRTKLDEAVSQGYKVLVFWEIDLMKYTDREIVEIILQQQ